MAQSHDVRPVSRQKSFLGKLTTGLVLNSLKIMVGAGLLHHEHRLVLFIQPLGHGSQLAIVGLRTSIRVLSMATIPRLARKPLLLDHNRLVVRCTFY